jgi:hypothetical protein
MQDVNGPLPEHLLPFWAQTWLQWKKTRWTSGEQSYSLKSDTQVLKNEQARTARVSSWDVSGRNGDSWQIKPVETRVLTDLKGPGLVNTYPIF